MKRYVTLLALVLLAMQLVFAGDEPKQCTINVKGMTCGGCVSRVKNAVRSLDGVQSVDVSLEKGIAVVSFLPAKLSEKDLLASIEKTGFAATVTEEPQEEKMKKKEMGGQMKMVMSPEMDKARADLKAAKAKLAKEGHYSCCNAPTCDNCAISMNMCPCGDNVVKGEPVCGECADGWSVGHGAIPNVDPATVKRFPHDMLKMGYDMKAKMYGEMKEGKQEKMK